MSIIANFARLRRDERKAILKKTKKFLSKRGAFVDPRQRIMSNDGEDIEEVRDYAEYMDRSLRPENEARGRYFDVGRLWTFMAGRRLRFHDPQSGEDLPDLAETGDRLIEAEDQRREAEARVEQEAAARRREAAARQAAETRVQQEVAARQAAEARLAELERAVQRQSR